MPAYVPVALSGQALGMPSPAMHRAIAWTGDPYAGESNLAPGAGGIYLSKMPIPVSGPTAKVWWYVASPAVTPAAGQNWIGIYSIAGPLATLLGQGSADADCLSAGAKGTPLVAQLLYGTYVYAAFLFNAVTTPSLRTGAQGVSGVNFNLAAPNLRYATVGAGLATLPATIDLTTAVNTSSFWAAVS